MKRRSGLGRGLDALLPSSAEEPERRGGMTEVPIDAIARNPNQPRDRFEAGPLDELVASIRHLGVLQPLLVREAEGGFELIAGERRLRAARSAGLTSVPVVVLDTDERGSLERALVENLHREDLNPIEEAAAYRQLLEEGGFSQEELGQRLGRNRTTITNSLRLLELPAEIQVMLVEGRLTAGHGRALLGLNGNPFQMRLAARVADGSGSVRETEALVRSYREMTGEERSPRRRELPPYAGAAQRRLSESLGARVRIEVGKRKGKVVVEFAGEEELDRIVGAMTGEPQGAGSGGVAVEIAPEPGQ